MRSERVFTNLTCNQACSFCTARRPAEDRSFIERRAVERRIAEARARGAAQIVLTGGEPTLRRDLTDLVRQTRATGAEVVLETNATLIGEEQARALREAGLEIARVHLSGWGHGLDAVTRDEGGFAAATAGLRALLGAGLRVEVSAAIVRSTAPLIAALPAALAGISVDGQSIRGLWLVIPTASPAPGELLSYQEAAGVAAEAAAQARAHGLWVQLSPDSPMPPCVYPPKERPAHLFALTAGGGDRPGFRRAEACGRCAVRDRCPGLPGDYLDRWPAGDLYPISDDRGRRRLSLISSVEQQIARELVSPNLGWNADGTSYQEQIVRVVFQCNQSCRFCFVSTHLPAAPDAAIREAILDTTRRGLKVVLSGGEPTLSPRLIEYVRLAREHSALPIQLQTNAIRLDDAGLVRALTEAGVDEAFVSLHGSTAAISDRVTSAPGTFARTVVGLDNLHSAGVRVLLNFVICEANMHDLPAVVRLAGDRWPGAHLSVSFVAPSTDVVPRDGEMIPRYAEALPHVAEAIAEASRLGLAIGGFDSMCGIPLCLVPASLEGYFKGDAVPEGYDRGEFIKPEACQRCELGPRCYGLRRGYADLHGTGELRPVTRGAVS